MMNSLYPRIVKPALAYALKRAHHYPKETKWTIWGVVAGLIIWLFLGGVGIAAGGTAFGVPGLVLFPVLGGLLGNRLGICRDRKLPVNDRRA